MICVDGAAGPAPLASMVAPSPKVEPFATVTLAQQLTFQVFDVFELQLPSAWRKKVLAVDRQ